MTLFFRLVTVLVVPAIFVVIGVKQMIKPPVYSENAIGYRSKRSLSSGETWTFAQRVCGLVFLRAGILSAILSFFGSKVQGKYTVPVIIAAQCLVILISVGTIEGALKKEIKK